MVKLLLFYNSDADQRDIYGRNALYYACKNNNVWMVKVTGAKQRGYC